MHRLAPPTASLPASAYWALTALVYLACLAVLWVLAQWLQHTLVVLGLSLLLCYILLVPVNALEWVLLRVESWGFHHRLLGQRSWLKLPRFRARFFAVLLVAGLFVGGLSVGGARLVPKTVGQLQELNRSLPTYQQQVQTWLQTTPAFAEPVAWLQSIWNAEDAEGLSVPLLPVTNAAAVEPNALGLLLQGLWQPERLAEGLGKALNWVVQGLTHAAEQATSLLAQALTRLSALLVGGLLIFYMLLDGKRFAWQATHLVPKSWQPAFTKAASTAHQVLMAYVKGQVLLGLLTGFYMFLVYSFFGVKYAVLLGVLFAVAEFLPVVGTWLGLTPALVVVLLTQGPLVMLWVWLASYAFQTVKDNILAPKIAGDFMGLHPIVVIMTLLVATKLAGLIGVLFALPMVSLAYRLLQQAAAASSPLLTASNPSASLPLAGGQAAGGNLQ